MPRCILISLVIIIVHFRQFSCKSSRSLMSSSDDVRTNMPGKHSTIITVVIFYFNHGPHQSHLLILFCPSSTECQFGNDLYELKATWNPDLGPPFGIMYCIECECEPVVKLMPDTLRPTIKRRRIVGYPKCRSIKDECPKLNCNKPVSMPGKCCKVCPDEMQSKFEIR